MQPFSTQKIIAWIKYEHPNIIYFLLCEKKIFSL